MRTSGSYSTFTPRRRAAVLSATVLFVPVFFSTGCSPRPEAHLPPEDDLPTYCRAVARRAQALVPEAEALALFHLGRVEERLGLEDEAIKLYRRALKIDSSLADAYRQIGFIYSQRNERHPEAIEAYQQALRADPQQGNCYTRIALIYMHQKRIDEAEELFREEIRVGTADENTYYNLGQALALKGQHKEAEAEYRKALEMDPYMRMAHYALATSLRALGSTVEADKALEQFRELKTMEDTARVDPTPGSTNRKDQLSFTAETWMDAAYLCMEGRRRTKDPGRLAVLEREFLHATKESVRFDPSNGRALMTLLDYHRTQNDLPSALAVCEQVLEYAPSRDAIIAGYELAGQNLEGISPSQPDAAARSDQSLRLLQKMVALAPRFSDAHCEIARVILFLMANRPDLLPQAVEHARKAVELDPAPRNFDILAFAYMRSNRPREARETLDRGVSENPDDPTLRERLSKFLQKVEER